MNGIKITLVDDNRAEVEAWLDFQLARACETIGQRAERYAKEACPVGTPESTGIPHYQGGTLQNSITHNADSTGMVVGTNVHYAPYPELGTIYRKQPLKPYLIPSVRDHIQEYIDILNNAIK